ncbi:ThiF family adenylyltransferase [Mucilaginibacter defluvii]|uniref:ThiF family adenylyltransferase n=1 Tax=Mucilaginibacter defluvii TaxID=1196019 RepID=A0ABP9G1Q8_9SPHI
MSLQLINHSPDLKRLRDEGYEVEVHGGYLIIHHVPYLNNKLEIKYGTLVSQLTLANPTTTAPNPPHIIYFMGENPCNQDGSEITAIKNSNPIMLIREGVTTNHLFSNKPANGYPDYYEKLTTYIRVISGPAQAIDDQVTAKTFKVVPVVAEGSVFQYVDTNSSRAEILQINARLEGQKVAIIGLGGTGAYILDMLAKTPVGEIHIYDGDVLLQHNAFRSPGAASIEQLDQQLNKVEYYAEIYSRMHKHIIKHCYYVDARNVDELNNMTHVFIAIDKSRPRKLITEHLVGMNVNFIDVGLGVNIVDERLIGTLRVTTATPEKHDHLSGKLPGTDDDDNEYATNIQIAELNAMNAMLAVIKWKKLSGIYADVGGEHHSSYLVTTSKIINDDATS